MAAVPLLICDDSNMARKQLLRALPEDWAVSVTQASNGRQGLEAIRQGLGQVVLLDLTMPEMDGYQVLAALREEGLAARVIVVSGDVQEEAVRRVMALGALAFVKKPAEPEELRRVLIQCGVFAPGGPVQAAPLEAANQLVGFNDAFRETVNVAMGRAAALLAKVLGVFVQLPVPNVNVLEAGELHMALADAQGGRQLTAICQGYIGGGIAGEALLMFHDSSLADMARLMKRESNDHSNMEMLLDLSSIVIGACLSGIAEQVDVVFSQSHPQVLGEHARIDELIRVNQQRWKKTLAVEISYSVENHDIHFDLLLLFTESSVERLIGKLQYLMS
ncbi:MULTISPECIES: response regulator [unclassified Pseudomonas]|uniref:response regulator n=1 Tax=unclassified Pseudomonas TaxID=196821 RepID=UPI000BC44360|nr:MULTISPECIES: response regulator [unclassified Pseudomonas]PVZ08823.1 response regulator receiver domain-containing protein [Pseudomonas sp. URIL14HWK12:I12]PVZ21245.1 response regulator receiver domain-containing protein [Pseudomonas sp. URIL14HWK12:I10]PVZ30107.1 response regulator receiver domain-containing protein [Pseudomonas sp. URIL14HWK12:I11]SNZ18842.1 Response regulator containing CheY-like receiver domain and AraC-type DNA-binding domain [Pseudomonas sp. URIL14HWK12:I9]